jgi:hypothetical protein
VAATERGSGRRRRRAREPGERARRRDGRRGEGGVSGGGCEREVERKHTGIGNCILVFPHLNYFLDLPLCRRGRAEMAIAAAEERDRRREERRDGGYGCLMICR